MTLQRGKFYIFVEKANGLYKKPGLYIGNTENHSMTKVGSFRDCDKAEMFCECMRYLIGLVDEKAVKRE